MPHSLLDTLNWPADQAVDSFDGSAVPARMKVRKVKTRSRRRPERDSIQH
jgi:hypothetical protein